MWISSSVVAAVGVAVATVGVLIASVEVVAPTVGVTRTTVGVVVADGMGLTFDEPSFLTFGVRSNGVLQLCLLGMPVLFFGIFFGIDVTCVMGLVLIEVCVLFFAVFHFHTGEHPQNVIVLFSLHSPEHCPQTFTLPVLPSSRQRVALGENHGALSVKFVVLKLTLVGPPISPTEDAVSVNHIFVEGASQSALLSFQGPVAFFLSVDELSFVLEFFVRVGELSIAVHPSVAELSFVLLLSSAVVGHLYWRVVFLGFDVSSEVATMFLPLHELANILDAFFRDQFSALSVRLVIKPLALVEVGVLVDESALAFEFAFADVA